MNHIEVLEGKIAVLTRRIDILEKAQAQQLAFDADDLEAQRIAGEAGFAVEILRMPKRFKERRELARRLRKKNWSKARIARAFRVSERTAERWLEPTGVPTGNK